MNKIDFFKAILLTNKDFDTTTINKHIDYFISKIYLDNDLSKFFLKEQYEVEELFNQFSLSEGKLDDQSEYYGSNSYLLEVIYDENRKILESIIKSEEGKIIFTVRGLKIIPIKNDSNTPFYKGVAICKNTNDKYGLISKYGELILEPKFDEIKLYALNDYLVFQEKEKFGIIDIRGNTMLNPTYDYIINQEDAYFATEEGQIYGHVNDYLIVMLDKWFGLLDKDLQLVFPCSYKGIYAVEHDYYCYSGLIYFILENEQNKFAMYNPSKKTLTNFDWDEVYWQANRNILPFRRGNNYGLFFIKTRNEIMMDFPFELNSLVKGKYYHMKHKEKDKYALFDDDFKQLTRFEFDVPITFTPNNEVYIFVERYKPFGVKTIMSEIEFFKKYSL